MRKKEVKAILFDMDGVLSDSYNAWCYVINDALVSIKRSPLSRRELKKHFGAPVEKDAKTHFKGLSISKIRALYLKFFWGRKHLIRPMPQAKAALRDAKGKGLKIGLISNSTDDIINFTLRHLGIKKYFDVIMTMDNVKRRKPHPEMVLKACKILKVRPEETVVVGDTDNDMLAGKRAGAITIGFKIKGDYTIRNLSSIMSVLEKL